MKQLCLFLLGSIAIVSCNKDTEVEPDKTEFYTIEGVASYLPFNVDPWVLASDDKGNWLDVVNFTQGQKTVLKGAIGELTSFNLHLVFVHDRGDGTKSFNCTSYEDVSINGTWKLTGLGPVTQGPTQTAKVKLTGYNGSFTANPPTTSVSGVGGNLTGDMSLTGQELEITFLLDGGSEFVLSSRYGNTAYYEILKNILPGSTTTVTSLKPMDIPVLVDFPGNTFFLCGFYGYHPGDDTNKTGYILSQNIDFVGGVPPLSMGYINGFDKYRTFISFDLGKMSHLYEKVGGTITAVPDFSSLTVTFGNKILQNFRCTPNVPFHSAYFYFRSTSDTFANWTIHTKGNGGTGESGMALTRLPKLFAEKHPELSLNELTFFKGAWTQYLDDFTYEHLIAYYSDWSNKSLRYRSNEYFYYSIRE